MASNRIQSKRITKDDVVIGNFKSRHVARACFMKMRFRGPRLEASSVRASDR
jgi:hypothetical protein